MVNGRDPVPCTSLHDWDGVLVPNNSRVGDDSGTSMLGGRKISYWFVLKFDTQAAYEAWLLQKLHKMGEIPKVQCMKYP